MSGKRWIAAFVCALANGCATIVTDAGQSLRVATFSGQGEAVKGALCRLENDNGQFSVVTPGAVTVRKSGDDLLIVCTDGSSSGQRTESRCMSLDLLKQ